MPRRPAPTGTRARLLYDSDCGFCARTARWVHRSLPLDVDIEAMTTHTAAGLARLAELGVDPARAIREMPVLDPDGSVAYGHRGWARALAAARPGVAGSILRGVGRLLGSRPVEPLARRGYGWVAENRHRLPGGSAGCTLGE